MTGQSLVGLSASSHLPQRNERSCWREGQEREGVGVESDAAAKMVEDQHIDNQDNPIRSGPEHHTHKQCNTNLQNGFALKSSATNGNLFIEQMISERLRDLVAVEPNGKIKLNLREQMSARL